MSNTLLCKECIHSRMSLMDKIFTLGGRVGRNIDVFYHCARFIEEEKVINNMVTGTTVVPEKMPFCTTVRSYGPCGISAKGWSPKHKKDLFKMLTKEEHD